MPNTQINPTGNKRGTFFISGGCASGLFISLYVRNMNNNDYKSNIGARDWARILLAVIFLIIISANSEGQSSALVLAEQQLRYIEQASDSDLLQEEDISRPYLSGGARAKYYEKGLLKSNKFINLKFDKISRSHLKRLRSKAHKIYSNENNSLPRRQAAFEFLRDTMVHGTNQSILDKYLKWDTMSRITENAEVYSMHLLSPDGTDSWLTIANGKVIRLW